VVVVAVGLLASVLLAYPDTSGSDQPYCAELPLHPGVPAQHTTLDDTVLYVATAGTPVKYGPLMVCPKS
jgi:hypothetical protein